MLQQRFRGLRLSDPYRPEVDLGLSHQCSPPTALYRSSLAWFGAGSWKRTPKGLPSSLMQLVHDRSVHREPSFLAPAAHSRWPSGSGWRPRRSQPAASRKRRKGRCPREPSRPPGRGGADQGAAADAHEGRDEGGPFGAAQRAGWVEDLDKTVLLPVAGAVTAGGGRGGGLALGGGVVGVGGGLGGFFFLGGEGVFRRPGGVV